MDETFSPKTVLLQKTLNDFKLTNGRFSPLVRMGTPEQDEGNCRGKKEGRVLSCV